MKNNKNLIGIGVGLAGLAYGLYSQSKMERVAHKLNVTINDLASNMEVEVPKGIIKAATEQAVNKEVSKVARDAVIDISDEITNNVRKQVKDAVDVRFDSLSEKVANELSIQVAKIDTDALSAKVVKKAEEKILAKFDTVLDGSVTEFNKKLSVADQMYASMLKKNAINSVYGYRL